MSNCACVPAPGLHVAPAHTHGLLEGVAVVHPEAIRGATGEAAVVLVEGDTEDLQARVLHFCCSLSGAYMSRPVPLRQLPETMCVPGLWLGCRLPRCRELCCCCCGKGDLKDFFKAERGRQRGGDT